MDDTCEGRRAAMTALQLELPIADEPDEFEAYNAKNPEVYALLVRLARELRASGVRKYGARALWERLRWHVHVERTGSDYKLNNDLTSKYARRIMELEPDLTGFFEVRNHG